MVVGRSGIESVLNEDEVLLLRKKSLKMDTLEGCTMLSHSVMSDSLRPHGLYPTSLLCSRGFSRQEHWSGLPCPPPGHLPNSGIEPRSLTLQVDSLPSEPPGKPR